MPSLKAMAREAQQKSKSGTLKKPPNRKQTVFKSTERVADSDLESETESESESESEEGSAIAPVPVAKLNGHKPKPVAPSKEVDNVEEDDDKEDESESQGDAVISSSHSSASGESSGNNDSSDSDSELEEEHEHTKVRVAAKASRYIEEDIQLKPGEPRVTPIYNPPDGFAILTKNNNGNQKVAEVFGHTNLAGKQLWYITAPASVPISAVKQVSLQDVQLGKPALSLGGRDYGFVQDQAGNRSFTKVLIPEENSTAYRVGHRAVDQTLHLQQIVQLHKATNTSSPTSGIPATLAKRSARKQPEGLKMRFRPIGFGNGKTGTIGSSSSSSDVSSSTDTNVDEEMEDAPPVSRQPLGLDQANIRLSELASRTSESQDDTSSSEKEIDDPPPATAKNVALVDSPSGFDGSSETSNDEMVEVPKSTSTSEESSSQLPRSLKRKLSDFKKDDKTANTLHEPFKANGLSLKTANIKKLSTAPVESVSKVTGDENTAKQKIPFASPSKMTPILPPKSSETASRLVSFSKSKVTPVPPPRQSSILPSDRGSKSLDVPRAMKAAGAMPKTSSVKVKVAGFRLPSEKNDQKSLEDPIDPALSEKERKKEIRRLGKKEASHMSKGHRSESMNSATNDTLNRSVNASSPPRNAREHPSQKRSPIKASMNEDLSQNVKQSLMTNTQKVSKKPKKHDSNWETNNGKGDRSRHEISTSIPSPRKESVILPPKFVRSLSK